MPGPPKITIVTPSFNQGRFLGETIRSVLEQNYPNLEYAIIDGGSTDNSVEIIRKSEDRLAFWVSEPDDGMYEAIDKGFARTGGEIMGWINADDKHLPWTLKVVSEIFQHFPSVEWITTLFPMCLGEQGFPVFTRAADGYSPNAFLRGSNLPGGSWYSENHIQQEGTFWRRSLWQRCGGRMDMSLKNAGDFELWARFFAHGAELCGVAVPLAGFRYHADQKTNTLQADYLREAVEALKKNGGWPYRRWETWVLRRWSKLIRSLQRRFIRRLTASQQYPCIDRRRGDWQLSRR